MPKGVHYIQMHWRKELNCIFNGRAYIFVLKMTECILLKEPFSSNTSERFTRTKIKMMKLKEVGGGFK